MKLPKVKMPNLKMPKTNGKQSELTNLFKNNKNMNGNGLLNEAKKQVPEPIKNFIPDLKMDGSKDIDISKIVQKSSLDVEGVLSKSMDVNSIIKTVQAEIDI